MESALIDFCLSKSLQHVAGAFGFDLKHAFAVAKLPHQIRVQDHVAQVQEEALEGLQAIVGEECCMGIGVEAHHRLVVEGLVLQEVMGPANDFCLCHGMSFNAHREGIVSFHPGLVIILADACEMRYSQSTSLFISEQISSVSQEDHIVFLVPNRLQEESLFWLSVHWVGVYFRNTGRWAVSRESTMPHAILSSGGREPK